MRKVLLIFFVIAVSTLAIAAQGKGKITGKLRYPSEELPANMLVCIEPTGPGFAYCSNEGSKNLSRAGFAIKVDLVRGVYEITAPKGEYYVFSKFMPGKAPTPDVQNMVAFYTEFMKCGMHERCKSHKKLKVKVKSGKTTRNIDIGDWWV